MHPLDTQKYKVTPTRLHTASHGSVNRQMHRSVWVCSCSVGICVQDVRKAVLHSLSAAPCSLPEILDRTRDINDEVQADVTMDQHFVLSSAMQLWQTVATDMLHCQGLGRFCICLTEMVVLLQVRKMAFAAIRDRVPMQYLR